MREISTILLIVFVGHLAGACLALTIQLELYVDEGIERKVLVESKDVCEAELPRSQSCRLVWHWEPDE